MFYSVNSKAVQVIGNFTPEQLRSQRAKFNYAPSTLEKHPWITTMYEKYCVQWEAEIMWPIQPEVCENFLLFLFNHGKLACSSIRCVVVPGLKRINKEKTGLILCLI
jgi:hypothetical protein